ncbi:VOC family protein [Streptomyces sp. NPDC057638]|uniref:VOC family protein n=1 Tax=Streptomyces sp. NPDC057638 TaxID=3346190 RepID=UPI0036B17BD1
MNLKVEMVTVDCADPRELAGWWAKVLGAEIAQDYEGEFVIVGAQPLVLGFQRVPEPKAGKNRMHLDFHTEDRGAEVERLVALGATVIGEVSEGPLTWSVLRDPEENEFCVGG